MKIISSLINYPKKCNLNMIYNNDSYLNFNIIILIKVIKIYYEFTENSQIFFILKKYIFIDI